MARIVVQPLGNTDPFPKHVFGSGSYTVACVQATFPAPIPLPSKPYLPTLNPETIPNYPQTPSNWFSSPPTKNSDTPHTPKPRHPNQARIEQFCTFSPGIVDFTQVHMNSQFNDIASIDEELSFQ
jgi:hypothetical protein